MIRQADAEDAAIIHKIMLSAFEEYRHTDDPSGALKETVSSIEASSKKWLRKSPALLFGRSSGGRAASFYFQAINTKKQFITKYFPNGRGLSG
ncbi:hypothetical protein CSTERTH_05605 [Thermoclostridium stercorarium subsp. thermolacticum DSM 2910]|uniref:Uncharacterized protein n=1 Tax=Thermoclostridium stercorarium subsp. thermolacticum DSM 2910 TaxID=1121336 RepID=A0A1B1YCS2_THEST|nr:hypothetical protein CSTERTH_05605 [Thermoclostridium stercorarium subsp. thermolacticum DSM 2910]